MISLKAFLPTLACLLGLSPAALYERQRALVRLGILPTPTARGRNSGGAMATPDSVGMMLIAVLVTDNLSEMDDRIASFADKEAFDPATGKATRCRFTKEKTLRRALAAALADSKISATLNIELARKAMTARLIDIDGLFKPSWFGRPSHDGGIELKATFGDLHSLSRELEETSTCKATSENDPQADGQSSSSSTTPPPANANASGTASKGRKGRRKSSARV